MRDRAQQLIHRGLADGAALQRDHDRPLRLAVVACGYDTDFEPVADQTLSKIQQLTETFGLDGPARWSLWIVDDQPQARHLSDGVRAAFAAAPPGLLQAGRLQITAYDAADPWSQKGAALRHGMAWALAEGAPDAVAYVNLNLKVHAAHLATGLRLILSGHDAALATRAPRSGGAVVGAGALGRLKSHAFSGLTRAALPPTRGHRDPTAPMKIFTAEAAQGLAQAGQIDACTMDCEWITLLHAQGARVGQWPIAWVQRPGSRPPWAVVGRGVADLWRTRRRWRRGALTAP